MSAPTDRMSNRLSWGAAHAHQPVAAGIDRGVFLSRDERGRARRDERTLFRDGEKQATVECVYVCFH